MLHQEGKRWGVIRVHVCTCTHRHSSPILLSCKGLGLNFVCQTILFDQRRTFVSLLQILNTFSLIFTSFYQKYLPKHFTMSSKTVYHKILRLRVKITLWLRLNEAYGCSNISLLPTGIFNPKWDLQAQVCLTVV